MERWCTELADNKLKRLVSLGLVCLMLVPVIAFATDNTATQTGTPTAGETAKPENILGYYELPEQERYQNALDKASFNTREELLAAFDDYAFLCETEEYEMYLDEVTLGIIIRDKESGAIMESVMDAETAAQRKYSSVNAAPKVSAIAIKVLKEIPVSRNTRVEESQMTGCSGFVQKVEKLENGFKAHIKYSGLFKEEDKITIDDFTVSFDFVVTLEDDGMHATIPHESITYSKTGYCISDVYVYAMMGYTERGDRDGYLIIPDGNGAIVDYEDFVEIDNETKSLESWKFGSGYSQYVYGEDLSYSSFVTTFSEDSIAGANDPEFIYAPYWGAVHEDTQMAVLGVADEGDASMMIQATFNGVNGGLENYASPRFVYRRAYFEPKDSNEANGILTMPEKDYIGDVKIHYMFMNGNDADYAGLAVKYRDKLIEEGTLTADKASDKLQVRVEMLGTDKEDFLIFRKTVTATTVDNIRTIINKLTDNGVDNMMVVYSGWQKGGVYNVPVSEYKVDSAVGGKAELNALADDLNKKDGIDFYLGQETQYINVANVKTTFDAAKKITKFAYNETRFFEEVYQDFRVLYPEKSAENINNLVDEFLDNGIQNVVVEGMPSNIFTYTKKNELYTKQATIDHYLKAFEQVNEKMKLALDQPFKLFWSEMDAFVDMPLGNSMYNYETADIPFLAIVLNGTVDCYSEYVNFEADKSEYFLKLASYGVNPSFLLTYENPSILQYTNSNWIYTSEYIYYVDQIKAYYEKLGKVKELSEGSSIVDYTYDNNLSITTYGNGIEVYCDYENYLLAVYKDGEIIFGYAPQDEADLTLNQKYIMNTRYAVVAGAEKVREYIGKSVAKTTKIAVQYEEITYSNGVVVYNDYKAQTVRVAENGTMVYGYNTATGEELGQDELVSPATSNEKAGEVNE